MANCRCDNKSPWDWLSDLTLLPGQKRVLKPFGIGHATAAAFSWEISGLIARTPQAAGTVSGQDGVLEPLRDLRLARSLVTVAWRFVACRHPLFCYGICSCSCPLRKHKKHIQLVKKPGIWRVVIIWHVRCVRKSCTSFPSTA